MQLFLNATSPFARLARVAAIEKGVIERITLVPCDPWNNDPALLSHHPQARIPVLVTDDGTAIAESLLIAQYLDHLGNDRQLLPANSAAVLARTSVAYGLMEAAFGTVIARKHAGPAADTSVTGQRRLAAMERVLAQWLANIPPALPQAADTAVTLDALTTAIALAYVQFRLPELLAPAKYAALHTWLQQAQLRPSLHSTRFV